MDISMSHNMMLFGKSTKLYFAIVSGAFWLLGISNLLFVKGNTSISTSLFILGMVFGGVFTLINAFEDFLNTKFKIDFLMLFAAVGAAFIGKWGEASLLLFLFSLSHALEEYAMQRARKSITKLIGLSPTTALVRRQDKLMEVPLADLKVGNIIVVKPNSKIAADGVVTEGSSSVNQSSITGESIPVIKSALENWDMLGDHNQIKARHRVFAGTINGEGAMEVKVLKEAHDSTLSRLINLVKEAETQKSPTQHLADKFEKYYVPFVLVIISVLMFAFLLINETFQQSFYRAMSVLIAASPCALAISTPSATLAGIARAARYGVLIKGGRPLEALGGIKAIAFDKTGTLTEGNPSLTHVVPFGDCSRSYLLQAAVAVEALSDHPLAAAIVDGGMKELGPINIPKAQNIRAILAHGVKATWQEEIIHIGNRRLCEEITGESIPEVIDAQMSKLETQGHTAMLVLKGGKYLGIISVMDVARTEVKSVLDRLKSLGIGRIVMLTGDNQKVADAIAANIGITDPRGSMLPEQKVEAILKLKQEIGDVAMVGDGANDAPAMAYSTVGISMGAASSDVALETADIALMADNLDMLPFAIGLSRKANRIIIQNLFISLGMVVLLVPLTITGSITIGPAVFGHEGSTILVVLNALRLLRYDL